LHILPLTAFSHPNLSQNASKIAILRPFEPYQVSNFLTWSQSLAVCVKVSNWSNMSQSQVCVKLIEMVQ
jgi:hypothetical protein